MTVEPLVAYAGGSGSIEIIDLNEIDKKIAKLSVECPSVDVTGPTPPGGGGAGGAGIFLLLGLGVLGIAMTGKKK